VFLQNAAGFNNWTPRVFPSFAADTDIWFVGGCDTAGAILNVQASFAVV
jgi:hypothetical protein